MYIYILYTYTRFLPTVVVLCAPCYQRRLLQFAMAVEVVVARDASTEIRIVTNKKTGFEASLFKIKKS